MKTLCEAHITATYLEQTGDALACAPCCVVFDGIKVQFGVLSGHGGKGWVLPPGSYIPLER